MRWALAAVSVAGADVLAPGQAWAQCVVGGTTVTCDTTPTTNTTFPANAPNDRNYQGLLPVPVVVTVSPGATVSGNGIAVSNAGTGGVTITNNGAISVDPGNTPTAGGTAALSVVAAGGPITYTGGSITSNGNGNAFDATQSGGVGSINLIITGAVSAATGSGVVLRDVATSTGISVTTGAVTALTSGQNGIDAQNQSLTDGITEIANGNVRAGNIGMTAAVLPLAATGNINVTANGTIDALTGIDTRNSGTGTTSVTTAGPVTATSGNGILALTAGGGVTVTAGDVGSTGNTAIVARQSSAAGAGAVNVTATGNVWGTTGIAATNSGTGTVRVAGTGNTTGTAAEAIAASSTSGNIDIVSTGTAAGATNGITATSASGTVTVAGTGAVIAANGNGIFASSTTGNVVISASTVTASGGASIRGEAGGGGNVTVTSTRLVSSTTDAGIFAATNDGLVFVTSHGPVSGVTAGISGTALGSGSVSILANTNVVANGNGILATLQGTGAGRIGVGQRAGSRITATTGDGIRTNSGTSTGATTIRVADEIRARGAGSAGVRGSSTTGDITVTVADTGKIDPDFGVALDTVSGALVVNNAGFVTARVASVKLVATGTGTATVNNSRTMLGDVIGTLNGGAFTLINSSILGGAINVTGSNIAASTWTNSGRWTATGESSFSGNLTNTGAGNLDVGGTLAILGSTVNSGRVNFAGAGSFTTAGAMTNSGIINAQNNLTTNVVTVGGNYTGGGQFFADYSTVTATADRLNIAGTASGNTNVTMNRVGARSLVPGGFLPVVTVTPGAATTAFTSNTVFDTTGFILESFGRNPANTTQFGLIQTVNPVAALLGALTYMAEAASDTLDEPISPFVTMRNDPPAGAMRFGLWMRGGGGHTNERIDSTFAGGGVTYASSSRFHIEHSAAQLGAEVGFLNLGGGGWSLNAGVTGGWYGARVAVNAADRIKVETPFLGGYVVVGNEAAKLEGSVRKEWRHYKLAMPALFGAIGTRKVDDRATAWMVRGSYRVGGATGFAATPFASFHYADSDIDPLAVDAATAWTPGSGRARVGQAGLRLSWRGSSPTGVTIEPFASAARLENWARRDSSSFAFESPATTFSLDTIAWKSAMRYSAGIAGKAEDGRVSGFVSGSVDDGSRRRSFTLNARIRFYFQTCLPEDHRCGVSQGHRLGRSGPSSEEAPLYEVGHRDPARLLATRPALDA